MQYELAMVIKLQSTDENKASLLQKIESLFTDNGFDIKPISVSDDVAGRRKLAYPIKGEVEGIFLFYTLFENKDNASSSLDKIKLKLKNDKVISQNLLRYLILKQDNL
jgi:ribosomal protein S6